MAEVIAQDYELVDIEQLQPHPQNPRRGNVAEIEDSIRANGFYGTLIVQRSTNYVIAGNHRFLAAVNVGLNQVPVLWADVDDATAVRILLVDNRANDAAGYDEALLASMLTEIMEEGGLEGTGYNADAVDDLLAKIGALEVTEALDFLGDYAEDDEEVEARTNTGTQTKLAQGLREVVLVYSERDYQKFVARVQHRRTEYATDSTSATVLMALAGNDD